MTINELKQLSKEDLLKRPGMTEIIYDGLHNSKSGYISIKRIGDDAGDEGIVEAFGTGISCVITNPNRYYYTSVVKNINWDNNTFTTENSTYKFKFKPFNTESK